MKYENNYVVAFVDTSKIWPQDIFFLFVILKEIYIKTRTIFKKKDVRRSTNIIFFYEQYFTEIT